MKVGIGEVVPLAPLPPAAIVCVGDPVPTGAVVPTPMVVLLLKLLYPYENAPLPGATGTELGIASVCIVRTVDWTVVVLVRSPSAAVAAWFRYDADALIGVEAMGMGALVGVEAMGMGAYPMLLLSDAVGMGIAELVTLLLLLLVLLVELHIASAWATVYFAPESG